MRFNRHILSITALILALGYTLWFVFAGFGNHQDPLYWLYKYAHLEGGWMAVGSLLTGGAVVRLFGAQILPLRLFGWLCTVTAIALPYCSLLDAKQRRDNLHWLALTFLLMGYGAFQEFSPGTLSVLLLSALWVTSIKSSADRRYTIASAVLLGLVVAARIPNIVVLLILLPIWKKKSLWAIPVAALTAGLVYLMGYLFVTPAAMDSTMTGTHAFLSMCTKLWENGGKLLGCMLMGVGVLAIGKLTVSRSSVVQSLAALFTGGILVYVLWSCTKATQWYNIDLTYCLSAFCLVLALGQLPMSTEQSAMGNKQLLLGVALLCVATLGTDTAWLKLFPAVLCLLPVAAQQYEEQERRFILIVLTLLAGFVMVRMTTNSIGRTDLSRATTVATISPYKGIAIQAEEQARLLQYKADFDSLSTTVHRTPILALGQEMHLMRAVTGCEAARFNEFWSNIFDSVYTAKYQPIIVAERPVVFVSFSPQFKTKPTYKDGASMFETMLQQEGYQPINRAAHKYMIYIPGETIKEESDGKEIR